MTALSCVDWVSVNFGPVVSTLDFTADKKRNQVFVVTNGGLGTIGLASAVQTGSTIKFKFKTPVCAGERARERRQQLFLVSKKTGDQHLGHNPRNQRRHPFGEGTRGEVGV